MAKTIHDLGERFKAVKNALAYLGMEPCNAGLDVNSLSVDWGRYHQDYRDLLRTSSRYAGGLRVVCDQYINVLLPAIMDNDISLGDLKRMARRYLERTRPTRREGYEHYMAAFEALSQNLQTFKLRVMTTFGDSMKRTLNDQVLVLERQIAQMQDSISWQKLFVSNWMTLAAGVAAGSVIGIGVALLLPVVAPASLGLALVIITSRQYPVCH
ncbi:hypothetical protein BDN72DRAFT_837953 [Pluteus cervinus]|uniref:Uncharacterized protein n=1 Tax=Pluteus cervinus TaxID=181527 RepID=A0ACD3B0A9_9AGAR|nr:hypothetical protein BDN72DRAFT_837953 [Pluteus cervinus]